MASPIRERKSIQQLWKDYQNGNKKPLSDLVKAWKAIQELDPEDPNSFFMIAGYHGSPFRGAGWGNAQWWGGYCNHGNVLFPTWHRAYLLRLENALRSVEGCGDVVLPYWNELDPESLKYGLPAVFTNKMFTLEDGTAIRNPLCSYKYQSPIWDNLSYPAINSSGSDTITTANPNYYRKPGDFTQRFPWSTLNYESDKKMAKEIEEYNAKLIEEEKRDPDALVSALNNNVACWLYNENAHLLKDPEHQATADTSSKYLRCLAAPNYTVFSNTTSAMEWNERKINVKSWGPLDKEKLTSPKAIVSLESPHNDMHLAIGGFQYPGLGNSNQKTQASSFGKVSASSGSHANQVMLTLGPDDFTPKVKSATLTLELADADLDGKKVDASSNNDEIEVKIAGKITVDRQGKTALLTEDPNDKYKWANGDMGENETAAFDPLFYFHHCFIDKTFWDWQKGHDSTTKLEIIEGYPGTNSVDSQGPTPGVAGGTWLTLQSPLTPFKKAELTSLRGGDKDGQTMATSEDVVDIEGQLGYTYIDEPATVFPLPQPGLPAQDIATVSGINRPQHHAIISGINRAQLSGSFVIAMHKVNTATKERTVVGYQAVLNRWKTAGCANCQTHLNVRAHIPLRALTKEDVEDKNVILEGSVIGRRATAKDDQIIDDYGTAEDAWRWEVMDTWEGTVVEKEKLTASSP